MRGCTRPETRYGREKGALGSLFVFFKLLASFSVKIIFCRDNFRFLVKVGCFKIPSNTGIPFSFDSCRVMAIQFSFEESKFGKIKSSP